MNRHDHEQTHSEAAKGLNVWHISCSDHTESLGSCRCLCRCETQTVRLHDVQSRQSGFHLKRLTPDLHSPGRLDIVRRHTQSSRAQSAPFSSQRLRMTSQRTSALSCTVTTTARHDRTLPPEIVISSESLWDKHLDRLY